MKRVTNIVHPKVSTRALSNGFYPFFDLVIITRQVLNYYIKVLIYEESNI